MNKSLLTFLLILVSYTFCNGQDSSANQRPKVCELVTFHGETIGSNNKLSWIIVNGGLVKAFTLQRSYCSEWEDISTRNDIDSSSEIQEFEEFDKSYSLPIVLYRIKTIYESDSVSYSHSVMINRLNNSDIYLWPNPTANQLFIQKHKISTLDLRIFDMNGKDISDMVLITENCYHKATLDLHVLAAGMYFVVENGQSHRFIKM